VAIKAGILSRAGGLTIRFNRSIGQHTSIHCGGAAEVEADAARSARRTRINRIVHLIILPNGLVQSRLPGAVDLLYGAGNGRDLANIVRAILIIPGHISRVAGRRRRIVTQSRTW